MPGTAGAENQPDLTVCMCVPNRQIGGGGERDERTRERQDSLPPST